MKRANGNHKQENKQGGLMRQAKAALNEQEIL